MESDIFEGEEGGEICPEVMSHTHEEVDCYATLSAFGFAEVVRTDVGTQSHLPQGEAGIIPEPLEVSSYPFTGGLLFAQHLCLVGFRRWPLQWYAPRGHVCFDNPHQAVGSIAY